jgi:hypothetical protein
MTRWGTSRPDRHRLRAFTSIRQPLATVVESSQRLSRGASESVRTSRGLRLGSLAEAAAKNVRTRCRRRILRLRLMLNLERSPFLRDIRHLRASSDVSPGTVGRMIAEIGSRHFELNRSEIRSVHRFGGEVYQRLCRARSCRHRGRDCVGRSNRPSGLGGVSPTHVDFDSRLNARSNSSCSARSQCPLKPDTRRPLATKSSCALVAISSQVGSSTTSAVAMRRFRFRERTRPSCQGFVIEW